MFSKNSARLLIAGCCVVFLVVLGISQFRHGEGPTAPPQQAARPVQAQAAHLPAIPETAPTQTSDAKAQESRPRVEESAQADPIPAFKQWAEKAAASGFAQADQPKGMELAKARAADMKALIKKDPATALRQALPADLRAALPPAIAAAIEQPVKTSGMVSLRMMCSHSGDESHGNCEAAPVLLEEIISWNAYYDQEKWRAHLGQTVQLDGIAVDEEVAVQSVTPVTVE